MNQSPDKNSPIPRSARVSPRLLWLGLAIALILLLAMFSRPRRNASVDGDSTTNTAQKRIAGASGSSVGRPPPRPSASAMSAQEIIASKLRQFGRSRHELVQRLAKHFNMEVSDDVERFFEAVESGDWERIDAAHRALLESPDQLNQPRSEELHHIWRPIQEAWGAAREAHNWPAQKFLDYGEAMLGSLRPGMIYVGGTDPGAFITSFMNETGDGEHHIVMTQNALASGPYLDYLNFVYGDRMNTLTQDDSQRAFQEYMADAQKRYQHDQDFPNEPKQLKPGENFSLKDGKPQISGQVAVMAVNEKLFQMLMNKNPDASFAIEQSFPFTSTYATATPLGPIMELRVQDPQNTLTADRAIQSAQYWRDTAAALTASADWTDALPPHYAYSHLAAEQAQLLLDRGYPAQAEQTLRVANDLGPGDPGAFFALINLLNSQGRTAEAREFAENLLRNLPPEAQQREVFGHTVDGTVRNAIDALKKKSQGR